MFNLLLKVSTKLFFISNLYNMVYAFYFIFLDFFNNYPLLSHKRWRTKKWSSKENIKKRRHLLLSGFIGEEFLALYSHLFYFYYDKGIQKCILKTDMLFSQSRWGDANIIFHHILTLHIPWRYKMDVKDTDILYLTLPVSITRSCCMWDHHVQ